MTDSGMDFDPTRQAEIERDERWLASLMTPTPSQQAVRRTRDAMHAAIDEEWLQSVSTPPAPPELIARVKTAVHAALIAEQRGARHRIFGALAAAAAILFAIGVARFAAYAPRSTPDLALGEDFASAWNAIANEGGMSSLTADMAYLDEEIDDWTGRPAGPPDEAELESIQDRMDRLFGPPDEFFGTS